MADKRIKDSFFWFRPTNRKHNNTPIPPRVICFRPGQVALRDGETKDAPGSVVKAPLMVSPSWLSTYHWGRYLTMKYLEVLYIKWETRWRDFDHWGKDIYQFLDEDPKRFRDRTRGGHERRLGLPTMDERHFDLTPLVSVPKLLLGDISQHGGGAWPAHHSHRVGTQLDIFYIPKDGGNKHCLCDCSLPNGNTWHPGLNAMLLHCLIEAGASRIVTDSSMLHKAFASSYGKDKFRGGKGTGSLAWSAVYKNGMKVPGAKPKASDFRHLDHFHVDILWSPFETAESRLIKQLYNPASSTKGKGP